LAYQRAPAPKIATVWEFDLEQAELSGAKLALIPCRIDILDGVQLRQEMSPPAVLLSSLLPTFLASSKLQRLHNQKNIN
jgi:hypothetical protein